MAKSKKGNARAYRPGREQPKDQQGDSETSRQQDPELRINLDLWQKEILETKGKINLALRAGRQVGKSTIISRLAGEYAIENKRSSIMIISATERQAYLLFSKVLLYIDSKYRLFIKTGKDRPTKTEIKLKNGSIIRCLPTGMDGLGIRGYTIDLLIADEAAFIPDSVWPAVIPMLATTGGKIILLSTPFGNRGYFYDCFSDDSFRKYHINAEDIAEQRDEPQKTFMKDHQEKQKKAMTKLQYAQEYLGEFVSDFQRVFSDEIIKKCCILDKTSTANTPGEFYLGVDVARMGADYSSFQILEKKNELIKHRDSILTKKKYTTDTFDKIIELNKEYKFKEIGLDAGSGSLGVGILDFLLREPEIKRKVRAMSNLSRQLDHRGEKKKSLFKEDMYLNLVALMEKSKILLLNDDDVIASLRAIQYEYNLDPGAKSSVKIFASKHGFTDLVEGLIRAAWLANQKHLNSFISYI